MSDHERLILEHFKKELDASRELLGILGQEEIILVEQNLDALEDITVKKNLLVQKFLQLKNSRQQQIPTIALPKDEALMANWISQQSSPHLHQIWAEITQILTTCQIFNNSNGKMIFKLSTINRISLQTLKGQDPIQSIYGSSASNNISKFNVKG